MSRIDESMYDLHRLRLLRELHLRGTLAAVAHALGYSPSAVSHQLGVLEREVGAELLEPIGRGVRLTATAETLVRHTEAILLELERAEAAVAASRADVGGTVRIATFQTVAHTLIPDALGDVRSAHPQLDVVFSHVDADAAIPALIARDFDVVLSERYPGEPATVRAGVLTEALMTDPLMVAAPVAWEVGRLGDLAERPWVMEHPGASVRAWSMSLCRNAGFEPRVSFESADVYLHAALVARGMCAAVLPRVAVVADERVTLLEAGQSRTIEVSVRSGTETAPAIAAVRAALERSARGLARG